MLSRFNQGAVVTILLVEDSDDDAELIRMAFQKSTFGVSLCRVSDGQECMKVLRRHDEYANARQPALVLLDLNMPGMSGQETLVQMKNDKTLCHVPVVILTTSADERDILQMYQLGCSSYIVKPLGFVQLTRMAQGLSEYWFTVINLPTVESAKS